MAWNLTLQNASFRGVRFEVESVQDTGEKALCVHEYPYRSGAEVEDMGRKPRVIPVTAIFWGTSYESGVRQLVAAFEETGPGELIHPVFGSITVAVRRWQIEHSAERPNYATVTFEAVEASTDNPFFGASSSHSLAQQALASIKESLSNALGLSENALVKALVECQAQYAQVRARVEQELQGVLNVLDEGQSVVRSVLSYVDYPAAFVSDVLAVVSGLQAEADSASSSVISSFAALSNALPLPSVSADEAIKTYAVGTQAYGSSWVSGPQSAAASRIEPQLALRVSRPAAEAITLPEAGSAQTPRGLAATHLVLASVQALALKVCDALQADMEDPLLTPNEIESMAGNVRARIDDALHYTAATLSEGSGSVFAVNEDLRTTAHAVQQLAEAALNARPPLASRFAERACNFHLLAHQLYGDYTRADELRRINPQVKNPNFIAKGQELLVYVR